MAAIAQMLLPPRSNRWIKAAARTGVTGTATASVRGGCGRWSTLAYAMGSKGIGIGAGDSGGGSMPTSNYVVPMDKATPSVVCTRPLVEILRDLNKRIPDNIVKQEDNTIPWYHANRLLSFYAAGWCGEICDVVFSEKATVTVVYRITVRGIDGEAYRESTGTVSLRDPEIEDPVAAAEEIAFCRTCARFGLGLYLYQDDQPQ